VRAVTTACGGVLAVVRIVVLLVPVAITGTSACATRAIEPKVLLSLAFKASNLVSRCTCTARSCFSASIAAARWPSTGALPGAQAPFRDGLRGAPMY